MTLLDKLFPNGHDVQIHEKVIVGEANTNDGRVAVLGTADAAAMDHAMAITLSGLILDVIKNHPARRLVFLVDTVGQVLSRSAELLCLNASFAHLASCVDLARKNGHKSIALVTHNAVSGGFISFGLMADRVYALEGVSVRVMDLKAMAKVTKIEHERLIELAKTEPIFAPGAENYRRMGAIDAIWAEPSDTLLADAFNSITDQSDSRLACGKDRGGRIFANATVDAILKA